MNRAALAETLDRVAGVLASAHDDWWVIGSAAVALHGAITDVSDIDILVSQRDGVTLMTRWHGGVTIGAASERFRSTPYARLAGAPLPIEVMGDLAVSVAGGWQRVVPATRIAIRGIFVPARTDLVDILYLFDRPKDRRRAALLI